MQVINGRLMRVDALSGQAVPYLNSERLALELTRNGIGANQAKLIANSPDLIFNPSETGVLVNAGNDLWYFDNGTSSLRRLTNDPGVELEAGFSPDGRWASFVRGNNLYVVDVIKGDSRQLSRDGREGDKAIYNGYLDWIYEEELYGRGLKRGYWWSPDSRSIAFLRLDEEKVPKFVIPDDVTNPQTVESTYYPKPGDPNPVVKLGIADIGKAQIIPNSARIPKIGEKLPPVLQRFGDSVKWADLSKYKPEDLLIGRVSWSQDGSVYFQAQNREQTFLDLNAVSSDGKVRKVLTETSPAWVGINDNPNFLKDGTFIWQSERDGWNHLYRYAPDGRMVQRLTDGKWEVRTVYGVSPDGWIYFSSIKDSPIAENVYRVRIDGGAVERISKTDGWHGGSFNSDFSMWVDYTSDVLTPSQVRLFRSDGSLVRVISENKVGLLADYKLSKPEFLKVRTRDGYEMEAMMVKPPDFDPTRKYPVFEFTYSGPHAPQVANRWGGNRGMWFQMLAQKGFIVWVCDNRSASGKGIEPTWPIYKRKFELELRDLEDGLNYLKSLPYVDGSRIALHGWSYGGSMTTYAMMHSKSWKVGIAGGTVSDDRLYDSIYMERYMMTPQNNPEGYANSSVLRAAKNLSGKLLLIHGAIDDNVHMQNTMQLVYELQKADKQFELMIYPTARHGLTDPAQVKHWYAMMTDFILKNL
jgi:dipeptidyl-peptidase-4